MHNAALPPISDEELARRAQRGCADSFDRLLRRFQVPVVQFLRHRGAALDADDLAQETFIRAFENLHRYRPRWPFSAWLFTIARRASINHHRRARPAVERLDADAAASPDAEPLEAMIAAEGRRRLWDLAADVLTEEQTTALWLHYVEGMPARGIALVLGRTAGSVKVMLFRARRRLLPLLAELDGERSRANRHETDDSRSSDVPRVSSVKLTKLQTIAGG